MHIDNKGFLQGEEFIERDPDDRSGYTDYRLHSKNIKRMGTIKPIKAIILHSTGGFNVGGAIMSGRGDQVPGTTFYINKKGKIFQAVSLYERTSHINNTTNRTNRLDIDTFNSIGIELVRMYRPDTGWDKVTEEQRVSTQKLLNFLLHYFKLSPKDILCHEEIQKKTLGEGKEILNLMKF